MKRTSDRFLSKDAEEFARYLRGVAILKDCAEGSIDLSYLDEEEPPSRYGREDTVFIAIIHDSNGYIPGASLVVLQGIGSRDEAAQAAFELLEESYRQDSVHMKDMEEDVKRDFMAKHDLSEADFQAMINSPMYKEPGFDSELADLRDQYWTQVDEWAFEGFDGMTWTLDAEEAAKVISKDKYASEEIEIIWPEGVGTEYEGRYY